MASYVKGSGVHRIHKAVLRRFSRSKTGMMESNAICG